MDTEDSPQPNNGQDATRQDDELCKVVAKRHACEHGKWSMELLEVSFSCSFLYIRKM